MQTATQKIQDIHALYCRLSKMQVRLGFDRERVWHEFFKAGFSEQDLQTVIKRLTRLIQSGDRRVESLKFSNLVERLDLFEEELAVDKAEAEGFKQGPKEMSVFELRTVLEAKQREAQMISDLNAHEDAFGLTWHNADARKRYLAIKREISDLAIRLAHAA